jgi:hypothetical protein
MEDLKKLFVKIESIDYYLPKNIETADTLLKENPDWPLNDIKTKTGIDVRYISDVSVIAPKPTTFKISLINSQFFYIYYLGGGEFMVKVSGKKYYSENLGELERASNSITSLLELNYAPTEVKEEAAPPTDKGADLGAELAAANTTPPAEEEAPEEEIEV